MSLSGTAFSRSTSPVALTAGVTGGNANRTLAVLMLAVITYSVTQTMVIPSLPVVQRDEGATAAHATWILTAFMLTSSVSVLFLGRLGDMYGRRRLLLVCLALFSLGLLIAAVSASVNGMIAGRAVQGLGGAIFPLSMGIVRDELPTDRVPFGIGSLAAMFGAGGAGAYVLAGVLSDGPGFIWIFWVGLAMGACSLAAAWLWIPASPPGGRGHVDTVGALLMTVTLLAFLLTLSQGSGWGWTSPRSLGLLAAAAGTGFIWVRRELRVPEPLIDMRFLAQRVVWTNSVSTLAIALSWMAIMVLVPMLAQTPERAGYGFGTSATAAGLFLVPSSILMLLAGPASAAMSRRLGGRAPIVTGGLIAAGSFAWLAVAHTDVFDVYAAGSVYGVGIGLAMAGGANLAVTSVAFEMTGISSALNMVTRTLGGSIGAPILGSLMSAAPGAHPPESAFTAACVLAAVSALVGAAIVLVVRLPDTRPRR
jgi:MFS family permease